MGELDAHFRLKDKIEKVAGEFAHIVIDCPPALGLLTVNALVAATSTPTSQPKRMTEARMKTNASETVLRSSSSSGTGFSSARRARARNRRIARPCATLRGSSARLLFGLGRM